MPTHFVPLDNFLKSSNKDKTVPHKQDVKLKKSNNVKKETSTDKNLENNLIFSSIKDVNTQQQELLSPTEKLCGISPLYHSDLFKIALNPTLITCKQLAWYGDSILNHTISQILFNKYLNKNNLINKEKFTINSQFTMEDLKTINEEREKYKTNQSLSCFLKYGAKEIYEMINVENNGANREQLNEHSIGTVFEAILCWAYHEDESRKKYILNQTKQINTEITTEWKLPSIKECDSENKATLFMVEKLMNWVDSEEGKLKVTKKPLLSLTISVDNYNDDDNDYRDNEKTTFEIEDLSKRYLEDFDNYNATKVTVSNNDLRDDSDSSEDEFGFNNLKHKGVSSSSGLKKSVTSNIFSPIQSMIREKANVFIKEEEKKKKEKKRSIISLMDASDSGIDYYDYLDEFGFNTMPHKEESTEMVWKSRSKNYYKQKIYPCCGTGGDYCNRAYWIDKDSYHSGKIVGGGTSRQGGGKAPTGSCNDHIPKGKGYWTCCYRDATSEGCIKTGYSNYLKKKSSEQTLFFTHPSLVDFEF
ncbi:hypothetical protein ABK040_012920 [Willaertia magna]